MRWTKWHAALVTLLFSVGIAGWWLGGDEGPPALANGISSKDNPSRSLDAGSAKNGGVASENANPASARLDAPFVPEPKSVADLLSRYELSGDVSLLRELQRLFPDDPQVIAASCLLATKPDDEWLKKLEDSQPDNSFPNLIRAALYADIGDLAGFRAEIESAMSKKGLNIGARERLAAILDRLLEEPGMINSKYIISSLDEAFMRQVDKIRIAFSQNPQLFGDELSSASMAAFLASKLRGMSDYNFTMGTGADYIEFEMLKHVLGTDMYGDTGMTVAQRQAQLSQSLIDSQNRTDVFRKYVLAENADPVRRLQFFTRMRSDGERAAFKWLWLDTKELRNRK